MDTTARRRKLQKVVSDSKNDLYPHDINMYNNYPQNSIPLAEFEELALERLQLLRILEQATLKGYKPFSEDWKKSIKEDLIKNGLKKYKRLMNGDTSSQNDLDFQARRADHLSHCILRLAYCRSEDLRRWFLNRELDWFKLKFLEQPPESIKKFLEVNNLIYTPISNEEKNEIKNDLIMSTIGISDVTCEQSDFYKVPFTDVISLVKSRRVYLKRGFAYIPMGELVVCVQSKFRANLNEALNICNHRLPSLDDDRLNSLLNNLHNTYTGKAYVTESEKESINPANIDMYAKQNFPLCMQHIHEVLKATHHLKHRCRLLFGLFLKGIGLKYEDAIEYWRQEFTKSMDNEKFNKSYLYNVKHVYGKVGNMIDYTPYSCYKVIMENVGPGEHHGCPFRHWDGAILKQKMLERGVATENVDSIIELVSNSHYQVACTKYFECIHGQAPANIISHPNQYFSESLNLLKNKQQKKS